MADVGRVGEGIDSHDVEAGGAILPAAGFEKGLGPADQPLLLGAVDGLFRSGVGVGPAAADFDKDQNPTVASYEVYLGQAGVDVPGQDAQTLLAEEFFSQLLSLATLFGAVGDMGHVRLGFGGRGLNLLGLAALGGKSPAFVAEADGFADPVSEVIEFGPADVAGADNLYGQHLG